MQFVVKGGSNAFVANGSGFGESISGTMAVMPGQVINLIAGGAGTQAPNDSFVNGGLGFANGGGAWDAGFSGGAASAMYVAGNLLAVSGGGGGVALGVAPGGSNTVSYRFVPPVGNGGSPSGGKGESVVIWSTADPNTVYATVNGGSPGTASGPGAGGVVTGNPDSSQTGNAATGRNGADGLRSIIGGGIPGSGGGGGGYFGGGSGGTGAVQKTGGRQTWGAGGGGGSGFLASGQTASFGTSTGPGSITIIFTN